MILLVNWWLELRSGDSVFIHVWGITMKELFLVRHAKSSWDDIALADFDRPLNARGKRDAPMMGQRWTSQGICPDLLISSPARRARKTARIIATQVGYTKQKIRFEPLIYDQDASGILRLIQRLDDACASVMLFGHNPALTNLANTLGREGIVNIPTCGMARFRFKTDQWRKIGRNTLVEMCLDYPKKGET